MSGVHFAKKNPTDTPNHYKGNQPMNTTHNPSAKFLKMLMDEYDRQVLLYINAGYSKERAVLYVEMNMEEWLETYKAGQS